MMPGWRIHLEVGERICEKLKYNAKQREEFLFGCLLPDINNGYINEVKIKHEHGETHWRYDERSSLNFYEKYKEEIDRREPIYMGYLVHLYTDGYFNYEFYREVGETDMGKELDHLELRGVKQHDFWKYDAKFENRTLEVSDKKRAVELAEGIDNVDIDVEDIEDVERTLGDKEFGAQKKNDEYIFYSEERLDRLMQEMITSFCKDYGIEG